MSEGASTVSAAHADREAFDTAFDRAPGAELTRRPVLRQAPARIVVVGEFNSGKTSVVNALVAAPVLPASFISHTPYPTIVTYAAKPALAGEMANRRRIPLAWDSIGTGTAHNIRRLHVGLPMARLRALRVVDTPGLALGDERRDAQTLRACRGADTIIWCTPATQAWKASEQRAWLTLPKHLRERGLLAVTFTDAIAASDVDRVLARLRGEAGPHFRDIVPSPALDALLPMLRDEKDVGPGRGPGTRAALLTAGLASADLR